MKVRAGFISNSSSSSYILRIPKGRELELDEFKDWFGIKVLEGESPDTLQKAIVGLWYGIYAYKDEREGKYSTYGYDVSVDAEQALEYYKQYAEGARLDKINQMLYEVQNPEEFPDTEIIGIEADDNEGTLINHDITSVLSHVGYNINMEGDNVYAINEH